MLFLATEDETCSEFDSGGEEGGGSRSGSGPDEDYVPGSHPPRAFISGDSSDEEWDSRPVQRRASKRHCRSLYASKVSSPLKPASRKCNGKGTGSAATPIKDWISSSHTRRRHPIPRRGRRNSSRRVVGAGDGEDNEAEELWRDIDDEDEEPPQPRFRPDRETGPQLNRTAHYTPLELFQLFFSTTVIDTLVKNTNTYGAKKYQSPKEKWVSVTSADMYSYICLVLYMGIVPLKTLKEFWRGSRLFSLPFPASVMPCRRFLAICRSLHMNDPAVEAANDQKKGTAGYDRLCKIRPLYEQILEACHTFFHPYQHICIDERMVASKGRFGFKQYSKNKPTKWGFKLFVLADSKCGYTLNFFVYGGKDGEPTGRGISYDAVIRLLNIPFLGSGYKLYVDNFYTSPTLFLDLLKRKIWACGTIRSNVSGYPRAKRNRMPERAPRGTIRWIRKGQLLFVRWYDTREVTMCSTMHKAFSSDTAKRKVKDARGQWTVKEVPIPSCVSDYNKHMGGVDLSDALIGYYNVLHKTHRWYKTLFYHFVDIATVNAFILHKEMCKLQNRPLMSQKHFREQLILSLAGIGSTPRRAGPQNFMIALSPLKVTPPNPSRMLPTSALAVPAGPVTSPQCAEVTPGSTHLTTSVPTTAAPTSAPDTPGLGHLPAYFVERMSNVTSRFRGTLGRRSCVVCKRKSPVYCSTCHKTLCITSFRNCYSHWHRNNKICI